MYGSSSPVVTLAQVRYEIGDTPRLNVAPGGFELLLPAPADGVTAVFPLRFANAQPSTITLFLQTTPAATNTAATPPPIYTPILPGDATHPWSATTDANGNPTITFASPPASGTVIGTRYQVTAFPDSILQAILADNQRSTATMTLKAVHYAVIPMILAAQERMTIYRLNDRSDDPSAFIAAQRDLMKMLQTFLDDEPGEGPSSYGHSYGGGGWW